MLVTRPSQLVTRSEMIDQVWFGNYHVADKGISQVIWKLRSYFKDSSKAPSFIETIPQKGYRFIYAQTPQAVEPQAPIVAGDHRREQPIGKWRAALAWLKAACHAHGFCQYRDVFVTA